MTSNIPQAIGADPINIQWKVVRGDTSTIRVEFLEADEVTFVDTTEWTYAATVYDPRTDEIDQLSVSPGTGYVDIVASKDITKLWGSNYASVVAELMFDLEVSVGSIVWTPVIGTVKVLGDITGGSL